MYVDDLKLFSGEINLGRTQECHLFQVPGANYADPINYRSKNKTILKSYTLLFSCVVHPELSTPN